MSVSAFVLYHGSSWRLTSFAVTSRDRRDGDANVLDRLLMYVDARTVVRLPLSIARVLGLLLSFRFCRTTHNLLVRLAP